REAKAAAKLAHQHIVPVHDFGQEGGQFYLISGYVRGRPLNKLIPEGGLPVPKAVALVAQLLEALDYAHAHGILHRDVKPANALVDERGHLFLMDFGLAGWLEAEGTRLTKSGAMLGSPAYMSPEQANSDLDQIGPRSD